MKPLEIKAGLFIALRELCNERIIAVNRSMRVAAKARKSETKSTAGDKHDTTRAMMQIEENKQKVTLSKALRLKEGLSKIDVSKELNVVDSGSVVRTNQGLFFISIGVGKFLFNEESYFAISLASPIGQLLLGKKEGDSFEFRATQYSIERIF